MSLGKRVKQMREKLKLSQDEVANLTGISRSNIGKIENDKINPNCSAVFELSKLFKVSTDWLISGEELFIPKKEVDILSGDIGRLSDTEVDIIMKFRKLDYDSQDDIMEFIDIKYKKLKRGTSSSLNTGGTDEEAATSEAI